jgi:hypothetical protein
VPELIWRYLTALLYYRASASGVALAEALETISHDRLTRLLQGDWSGPRRLERAWRTLFVWERGYLIIDETVSPKPFAAAIDGLAWVFSSQERTPVSGLGLVLRVWMAGTLRMPLGMRLGRKGGPSKDELAFALLRDARHRLRCHPDFVLLAAWYPSRALLKRIRDYGWSFVCRLQKTRRCNGPALRHHRRHPYWAECGWLSGGLNVLVVRGGKKVLRHQSPDTVDRRGAPPLWRPCADRGRHQGLQGSTGPDGLSSALGQGSTASHGLLPRRILCAGAGAVRSAPQYLHTQATAQFQGTLSCTPKPGAVETSFVTSDLGCMASKRTLGNGCRMRWGESSVGSAP